MKTLKYTLAGFAFLLLFGNCSKDSNSAAGPSSGQGGSTARFTTVGNYLYVVDNASLKAFLISNPQTPVYKSRTEIGLNIETIFPYDGKLFIGSSSSMYIFSLADPEKPTQIAKADYTIRMSCDPVVAKDNVAYATLRANGPCGGGQSALMVYNITNIGSPILERTVPLLAPYGLGIKDNALYVCEGPQGLLVFNKTNPYNPTLATTISGETFYDVIPYGNILIAQVQGGVALYDIGTNSLAPVFLSKINN